MYRYRRGTQISLSRCFLASALARSRKLFLELFGIVMEFQYDTTPTSTLLDNFWGYCIYFSFFSNYLEDSTVDSSLIFAKFCRVFLRSIFVNPPPLCLSAWRQKSPEQHFPRDSRRSRRTSRQSFEVSSWIFLARVNFPPPPAPPCSNVVESFFFSFPRNTWARVVACV